MPHNWKIFNHSNNGVSMAIRVYSMADLWALAPSVTGPSTNGLYTDLASFMNTSHVAAVRQAPYTRDVVVHWNNPTHFGQAQVFPARRFRVTYSGNSRKMGGFSNEAYISLGTSQYAPLVALHRQPILVDYHPGPLVDIITII